MRGLPHGVATTFAIALAAAAPAAGPGFSHVTAARTAAGDYQLEWRGAAGVPVDVYVADRANAPARARRLVVDNDTDGQARVRVAAPGRPYFYVAPDKRTGLWTAERVLPLQGGLNFRDLGGYATQDGRRVKWGKIYRSGSMAGLTLADYDYLSDLGIKAVCDFRTGEERKAEPNKWAEARKVAYWSRDYEMSFGDLGKLLSSGRTTPAQMKATMAAAYRQLPFEQAPAYREMFKRLAAGEIPLAFNCSAGKDRAGTAAALLLSALGVPRATVVADYALSDKVVDFRKAFSGNDASKSANNYVAKLSPEVVAPLLASDPDYIRNMFAAIEAKHGSVERYLHEVLGVTDRDLRTIRDQLLE